jgi:hypothetical protein
MCERRIALLRIGIVCDGAACEHPDTPHPLTLLCARRDRPRSHSTADQGDEPAPRLRGMATK